ncbi:MAG: class I SAM-dependent methyltransferase [Anaerolineales bacterium]
MDHFRQIYSHRAADYQRLIAPEDADGNLLAALRGLMDWRGKRLLDLGTGTGRIPLLLADEGARMVGLDLHANMLRENANQRTLRIGNWRLVRGDMRALPFADASADAVTAGWAVGHLRGWYADEWQTQIGFILREMERVVVSGGWLIIMETLKTGALTPAPPTEGLAEYYAWLENAWSFTRRIIRTDYQFASVEDAVARTEFFFGAELAEKIRANGWACVPEWTGMWTKSVTDKQ